MNKEEILAMEAGRELDALVAEKVMNLCVLDNVQMYGDGCVMSDKGFDEWTKHPEYGRTDDPEILAPYSSDISAAWEVAEKFQTYQVTKTHQVSLPSGPENMYRAILNANKFVAYAKTAPLAICRAALLAVME